MTTGERRIRSCCRRRARRTLQRQRGGALFLGLVLAACGSSPRLPPPPPYEPANSPEAATPCEQDRQQAQAARERLLEFDTVESRTQTAAAVFAQAECERSHFVDHDIAAPSQRKMADKILAARLRYQDAANLYEEIPKYGALRWTIGAQSRLGALHLAFANKLRQAPVPGEIHDPAERATFTEELESLAATIELRAVAAHVAALETATINPALVVEDEAVRAWTRASCVSLDRLDRAARKEQVVCTEWNSIEED